MNFYKQHCNMIQVTHKVKQIKRLATSSVNNNRSHASEDLNQFSDCRQTNSCPILNKRVCEVIPHLWLSWLSTSMFLEFVCTIHAFVRLTRMGGQVSPYIILLLRSVYSLTKQARHGRAFPSISTKSWSTAPAKKSQMPY